MHDMNSVCQPRIDTTGRVTKKDDKFSMRDDDFSFAGRERNLCTKSSSAWHQMSRAHAPGDSLD